VQQAMSALHPIATAKADIQGGCIHPTLVGPHLHPAVVGPHLGAPPSAGRAAAAPRDGAQCLFPPEALGRQCARVMTGPVAGAPAEAVDEQSRRACGARFRDGDGRADH
jgi:hypothetical protein